MIYAGCYGGYIGRLDHRTGQERSIAVWPDNPMGWGADGHEVPLPVDLPDRRPRPTTRTSLYAAGNVLFRTTERGLELGGDLPRPHAQRRLEDGAVGRPHHQGQHERRVLRDDLRPRRVAARREGPVGGLRRRPRPRDARRREDLDERHPEGDARVVAGQPDRRVAARPRHRLGRGEPLQARRLPAVRLRHDRLRRDLAAGGGRPARRLLRARRARGPEAARPPLRRHRDRRLRLVRRRRLLAARCSATCPSCRSPTSS